MVSELELSTPLSMRVPAPPLSEVGEQQRGAGHAGAAATSGIYQEFRARGAGDIAVTSREHDEL